MDKAKTVEFLQGMKFMQRKNESKRRELFEAQRRRALLDGEEVQEDSASFHGKDSVKTDGRSARPTVLRDNGFPVSQYPFSRQSFYVAPPVVVSSTSNEAGRKRPREEGGDDVEDVEGDAIDLWNEEEEGSEGEMQDPTAVGAAHAPREQTTESAPRAYGAEESSGSEGGEDSSQKRFILSQSVRAPPLPKSLIEKVAGRKKP